MTETLRVVGLMSGTSMDGIDAALLRIGGEPPDGVTWALEAFRSTPYPPERRALLEAAVDRGDPAALARLHVELGEWLAGATLELLEGAGVAPDAVAAVGSHGHTVHHAPPAEGVRGATLQLGDPATLAARTGIPVVSDFRAADVAAGGHGAPLVPWPDRVLLASERGPRALQNLGGIGNVTRLPRRGSDEPPVAFDTGPGNVLLDLAARRATGGRLAFDRDGALAREGTPDAALLERLLAHPFLDEAPPRSTGREAFGPGALDAIVEERGLRDGDEGAGWRDLLATLTVFTARTVADAYERWVLPLGVDEVVLTGGGARNPELVRRIREALEPLPVRTGAGALGIDPDAREAAAFAVLAWAWLRGHPGNVPGATGAARAVRLGSLTPAPTTSTDRHAAQGRA